MISQATSEVSDTRNLEKAYLQLQQSFADYPIRDHCLSNALAGIYSHEGLMVIGRAVNSWRSGLLTEEHFQSEENIFWQKAWHDMSHIHAECPMEWVLKYAGERIGADGKRLYNTTRSPFWRVTRKILSALNVLQIEHASQWPSHVIWSNLYKVAPHEGGNPLSKVRKLQQSACINILKAEIAMYKPRYILAMAGYWAENFFIDAELQKNNTYDPRVVINSGLIKIDNTHNAKLVIAQRPEGKNEENYAKQISQAYSLIQA